MPAPVGSLKCFVRPIAAPPAGRIARSCTGSGAGRDFASTRPAAFVYRAAVRWKRHSALWMAVVVGGAAARGSPQLDFARATLAALHGDAAAAQAGYEAALAADPDALPLVRAVAAGRLAAGRLEQASTVWREFARRQPRRLEAQLGYAGFLLDASPHDAVARRLAIETLENARATVAPGDPAERVLVARLFREYENAGRRQDSEALFRASLPRAAGDPAFALGLADFARVLFPADSAEGNQLRDSLHRQAFEAAPADPGIARTVAEYFRTTNRLDDAIRILEQHTKEAPQSLDLRVRLGILLLAAKRDDEGRAALEAVLAIDPRLALAHQTLAKYHRRTNQPEPARAHAAEALKLRGGDPGEFAELADEFLAADQPRAARLLLEKAVYHHPGDPALAARLAIASRRDPESAATAAGFFREAESLAAAAGDSSAITPAFLTEFAEVLVATGQIPPAEQRLRDAIRAYPPEAKREAAAAMRRLAGLWRQSGRNEAAAKALLQRADKLDQAP